MKQGKNHFSRRRFIKITGITALGAPFLTLADLTNKKISIISDPNDPIAASAPSKWAVNELFSALKSKGITVERLEQLAQTSNEELCIVVSGASTTIAKKLLKDSGTTIPDADEALGLVPINSGGKQLLLATANDERGIIYAILELADRVNYSLQPLTSLQINKPIIEKPAHSIRSLAKLFVSDIEDKPWFNDKEMWPHYLTMLATQRYNRFNLCLGLGYDFLRNVTDAYFLFSYPFLLSVPGYDVKAKGLADSERENNLRMLQFISEQTVSRGMRFQLGLWMHGYEWISSPNANYTISGLTAENHGPYCRDAVRALLQACPAISGVTFRIHGESGVTEGSYQFWRTVFDGVKTCGRKVEIDMHAKGMDQTMVDSAMATGLPITISPKYWAEHMGMPYHQADIRVLEIPDPQKKTSALMNLSEGSRSFMRYGYGDLLKEGRPYKVVTRIWPGTQRILLWGDPLTAEAHSRALSFCGTEGVEFMEPLSFKGRRGSGIAGSRNGYSDSSLNPKWDWQKYLYTYRVFGRMLYNPDCNQDVWQRYLRKQFGAAAEATELALANATRILPIVLTVHAASAANNNYLPEMYTNQPIVNPSANYYSQLDTPSPRVFGNVSPLDPQLFLRINDYVDELLKGNCSGKYSPVEYAQWLENYGNNATKYLNQAEVKTGRKNNADFRRMYIDVSIQVGLGLFFAAKFRAAALYEIFVQTGDETALEEALKMYRTARGYWAKAAIIAKDVYLHDVTVGERDFQRGHWLDRLPAIDEDIAAMSKKKADIKGDSSVDKIVIQAAIREILGIPYREIKTAHHIFPKKFSGSQQFDIEISFDSKPKSVSLFYRHVNQAERFINVEMQLVGEKYKANIPVTYTNSPYPIQYYFILRDGPDVANMYPGFNVTLTNQPYFIVRQG